VADAVATLLAEDADIDPVLVGPADVGAGLDTAAGLDIAARLDIASRLDTAAGLPGARGIRLVRVDVLPASGLVRMDAHPLEVLLAIQGPAVPSMSAHSFAIRACVRRAARAVDQQTTHMTRGPFAPLAGTSLADGPDNTNHEGGS